MNKKANTEAPVEVTDAPKYAIEKLRKNCIELFGITTSTFDGAMFSVAETELTIDDAKDIIDKFLYGGK